MDDRGIDCACLNHLRSNGLVSNTCRMDRIDHHWGNVDIGEPLLDTSHDLEASVSDSESCTSNPFPFGRKFDFLAGELSLEEEDKDYRFVKRIFLAGMGTLAKHTSIEAIHRKSHSSLLGRSRLQTFRIYSEAMSKKCGANINMKFAWYGSSKDDISDILRYGFGLCKTPEDGELYGCGIYLSPADSSMESIRSAPVDENGLRHLLFCRVIMGNSEEVLPGSRQFHPSSEEFDSGVDNQSSPKTYIVWSTHMNTHILPEYVISFRVPAGSNGLRRREVPIRMPKSAWLPFPKLISVLSGTLPASLISQIKKYRTDFMEKRITREYLIRRVRQIAGDKLLIEAIRSSRKKV